MRRAALFSMIASSAFGLARPAFAECNLPTAPCVDAEPMWQSPSAVRLTVVSDTGALGLGKLALGAGFTLRSAPAALNVPAPNQAGRDVNLISSALGWSLAGRIGMGRRLELTALAAGLSQRGAGIKGVTSQSAPAIDSPALQDPRLGFGYALPTWSRHFGAKIRFEAKLPLGNATALAGDPSVVASPSVAFSAERSGFFGGLELGARLRKPSDFFGLRVGSQALIAAGAGYEIAAARLSFAAELYLLPGLIDSGGYRYLPAEWLGTTRFAPRLFGNFSIGAGMGGGLPLTGNVGGASFGFGVPSYRVLAYVRLTPASN